MSTEPVTLWIGRTERIDALRLVLPHLWPARTRINVFVQTCSNVSSWRLRVGLMLTAVDEHEALAKLLRGRAGGKPGCHNDPRLLRRPVRHPMKIGVQCPRSSTRLCARRLLREESPSAHRCLFAPPPSVELLSGDGPSRIEVDYSGFCPRRVSWPSLRVRRRCRLFPQDASLWRDSSFFLMARGIEQVPQDDRD